MDRPRRTTSKSSPTATSAAEFKCPECGRTFNRAASLGAHRNRAHGITGASKRRTKASTAVTSSAGSNGTRRRRTTRRRNSTQPSTTATNTRQRGASINRNQLLQTLFPNGVPPREDVIRRISSWLDEAEQLSKL
jgi:predicted RNA-binding Zn-ribbon protein involved in translation (DUF1610 family)